MFPVVVMNSVPSLANAMREVFTEVVIAPAFTDEALATFAERTNLRVVRAPLGDRGKMKYRIIFHCGVETGVVTKRTFRSHLAGLHKSIQNALGVGRNIAVASFASHQFHGFFAQESGKQDFVQPIR